MKEFSDLINSRYQPIWMHPDVSDFYELQIELIAEIYNFNKYLGFSLKYIQYAEILYVKMFKSLSKCLNISELGWLFIMNITLLYYQLLLFFIYILFHRNSFELDLDSICVFSWINIYNNTSHMYCIFKLETQIYTSAKHNQNFAYVYNQLIINYPK